MWLNKCGSIAMLLWLAYVEQVRSCARTAGTTTPTPAPTTAPTTNTPVPTTTTPSMCDKCQNDFITITMNAQGSKPFDTDVTTADPTTGCLTRVLTCTGDTATVEVNDGANGVLGDQPGQNTVTITAMCSADGMSWLVDNVDKPVTQLECSVAVPLTPCESCNRMEIALTMNAQDSKPFDSVTFSTDSGCLVETVVCTGNQATVEFNGGDGVVTDDGTGTVTLMFTCDADGNFYLLSLDPTMTTPITQAECSAFVPPG